jgi:hypothetical protein
MRRPHRWLLIVSLLAVPAIATVATAAADPPDRTTWQADAKAPDPGPALTCAGGAGTVTPAVGAAETEYAGIGSASADHDISYVRVALSTAAPDGCAAAGGTHAQLEVIGPVDLSGADALCAVGSAAAQPCAVSTRPGEFGGVIIDDDRSGTPRPWAVGAPGAPLWVELPYDEANGTFGEEPEHRCAPAGPCSPEAAGERAQLVVRYLPGTGGTPSGPILTTVGLHEDSNFDGDGAGTGPATDDDDSDSFLYGPFPSRISRPSLRRGWTVHAYARKGKTATVRLTVGKHLIASGSAKAKRTGKLAIKVKLTRIGPKYLARKEGYLAIEVAGGTSMSEPVTLYGRSKA